MSQDLPPELKSFSRKSGLLGLLIFLTFVGAMHLMSTHEDLEPESLIRKVLIGLLFGSFGIFMLFVLYIGHLALPKCPKCGEKMRQLETLSKRGFLGDHTNWRIVACLHCRERYRIYGLS